MELHGRKKALRARPEVFPGFSGLLSFSHYLSLFLCLSIDRSLKQEGGEAHYIGQPSYRCAPR